MWCICSTTKLNLNLLLTDFFHKMVFFCYRLILKLEYSLFPMVSKRLHRRKKTVEPLVLEIVQICLKWDFGDTWSLHCLKDLLKPSVTLYLVYTFCEDCYLTHNVLFHSNYQSCSLPVPQGGHNPVSKTALEKFVSRAIFLISRTFQCLNEKHCDLKHLVSNIQTCWQ